MNIIDISILFFLVLFTVSGYIINFTKKSSLESVLYKKDKKSLFWFRTLVPVALILSTVIYFLKIGIISNSSTLTITGYFFLIFGFIIRWIAVFSLGNEFNASLTIIKNHKLKTNFIYKYVQHPSYSGLLIYYWGLAMLMQNIFGIILLTILPLIAVINRIKYEEELLLEYFKNDYAKYAKNTKKLFPFIY